METANTPPLASWQAQALERSQKRYEALMMFIGVRPMDPDKKVIEMAHRAFDYFDDDNSGAFSMTRIMSTRRVQNWRVLADRGVGFWGN